MWEVVNVEWTRDIVQLESIALVFFSLLRATGQVDSAYEAGGATIFDMMPLVDVIIFALGFHIMYETITSQQHYVCELIPSGIFSILILLLLVSFIDVEYRY
jgi:hypothetical protein